jgi:hypothetical protein
MKNLRRSPFALASIAFLLALASPVAAAGPQAQVRTVPTADCSATEIVVIYSEMHPGDVVVANVSIGATVEPGVSEGFYEDRLSGSGTAVEWGPMELPAGTLVSVAYTVNPFGPDDPNPTEPPPGTFGMPPIIELGDQYLTVDYTVGPCTPAAQPTLPVTSTSSSNSSSDSSVPWALLGLMGLAAVLLWIKTIRPSSPGRELLEEHFRGER